MNVKKQILIATAMNHFEDLREDLKEIMNMHFKTVQIDKTLLQFDDEISCLSGDQINRDVFSDHVTDLVKMNYGLKVDNQIWDEHADHLFYMDLMLVISKDRAMLHISYITIPTVIRKRGLADHVFKGLAELSMKLNLSNEVEMVDVSPDYNDFEGVSTHLCRKYGLKPCIDLFEKYGLYAA